MLHLHLTLDVKARGEQAACREELLFPFLHPKLSAACKPVLQTFLGRLFLLWEIGRAFAAAKFGRHLAGPIRPSCVSASARLY